MLKEIIANSFEKHISGRYIKDLSFNPPAETLYATALGNLNNHETEKAITYLILALDSEPNYQPAQHLGRVMLFTMSEEFIKKKGPSYKEKHPDLNKYIFSLEQNYTKAEKEMISLQNNITKLEAKMNEGFSLSSFLKKRETSGQLANMKEEMNKLNDELPRLKKELSKVSELVKIEEYAKIIAFILNVVTYPKRFTTSKIG